MRLYLAITLTCLVAMDTLATTTMPDDDDLLLRYLRAQRITAPVYDPCTAAGKQCVPGHFMCCEDFTCENKFGSLCLYPLEPCFCWPESKK